jgi:hypothetical protein
MVKVRGRDMQTGQVIIDGKQIDYFNRYQKYLGEKIHGKNVLLDERGRVIKENRKPKTKPELDLYLDDWERFEVGRELLEDKEFGLEKTITGACDRVIRKLMGENDWLYPEEARLLDYYVTPTDLLEFQMEKKGLDVKKMLPIGIPIRPQFSERMDRYEARSRLGLDPHKHTILLMSGSMGYGRIDESIERLDRLNFDFQVIVVCGNNKKMYKKVKGLVTKKRFDIYGYVDNVDMMMDAADCIITKPGGITTSEAMAKGLPMIMVNPIPGHEMRNAEFMLNNGLALYATKSFPLDEAVFSLFQHPERITLLRSTIEIYARQNSAQNLCDFLIEKVRPALP